MESILSLVEGFEMTGIAQIHSTQSKPNTQRCSKTRSA